MNVAKSKALVWNLSAREMSATTPTISQSDAVQESSCPMSCHVNVIAANRKHRIAMICSVLYRRYASKLSWLSYHHVKLSSTSRFLLVR